MPRQGNSPALLTLLFAIPFLALAMPAAPAVAAEEASPVREWLSEMEAYFEANPELKETPSSGWKPYNRAKWILERSIVDGELPSAADLWDVSEERLARLARGPAPRSAWFATGPVRYAGRILDIEFDPNNTDIVYVASASGGLWKSVDDGDSFTTTTDDLPVLEIGAVVVLPWDSDVVLIGTGEGNGAGVWGVGILKSSDGGQTWGATDFVREPFQHHGFSAMVANPVTHTILAAGRDGIWRSTDEGDTWTQSDTGLYFDVVLHPTDPNKVYAARGSNSTGNGVKKSSDDGLTFTHAGLGQPDQSLIGQTRLAVTPAAPDMVYANIVNRSTSQTLGVYRSANGGELWEERLSGVNMTGGQGWYNLSMACDPDNSERVIMGGTPLFASDNGALNIYQLPSGGMGDSTQVHVDHHAIAYKPGASDEVWTGTDGGVYRSLDDGASWVIRNRGIVSYQFYDIAVAQSDPMFMMGGTQDNGIPGRDGPSSWFPSTFYADGMVCNITPTNEDIVYSEWQFGNHIKSFNGGHNWFAIMNGITGNGAWVAPVAQDQVDVNTLFTATSSGIFRTENGGNLWELVASGLCYGLSISPVDHDLIWSISQTSVRFSTDGGDNWNTTPNWTFLRGSATSVYAHPTNANAVFVTYSVYADNRRRAVVSWDMGQNWEDISGDMPGIPINSIIVDALRPADWYIGTNAGVWLSQDGGATWLPYETGLPNVRVMDLEINSMARKLVAGTYGRGAWEIDLPDLTAAPEPWNPASLHLMLDRPFPNPAGERTTLRFAARDVGKASLDIFDVRGRLIEHVTAVNGDGIIRTIDWMPGKLSSGTYFAVLRAGEARITRKLVVRR